MTGGHAEVLEEFFFFPLITVTLSSNNFLLPGPGILTRPMHHDPVISLYFSKSKKDFPLLNWRGRF